MHTLDVEEKEGVLCMLKTFASTLKEEYAQYVEETVKIVEPMLSFSADPKIRQVAASILPELLNCLNAATIPKESLVVAGKRFADALILAHNKDESVETKSIHMLALGKIYRTLGHFMTLAHTKALIAKILNYFKQSDEQLNMLREYDADREEEVQKAMQEEEELSLIHICRCRRYAVCRSRWSPYH
eukprot:TRINITY_DN10551_c0_g3_i10.p1 TRINITY_DN10551_c0_g3~~TRINITY_DN10551_c0_g3_i10.p1  ORF type:complete len:187 (+),score=56.46 TRINITY_DN10551_c0_g3_i10:182-742(+)